MKITLAQLNNTVGDIRGNLALLKKASREASQHAADLIVFPEFFICGYPPRDLVDYQSFLDRVEEGIQAVIAFSKRVPNTGILFGAPRRSSDRQGKGLLNTALLVHEGDLLAQVNKNLLPTYDVFDEARYFDPAETEVGPVPFKEEKLGITICEDAWNDSGLYDWPLYRSNPVEAVANKGATILINISASPFGMGKIETRLRLAQHHAHQYRIPFIMVNEVGGNDELIFDGSSLALDGDGHLLAQLASFDDDVQTIDLASVPERLQFRPMPVVDSVYRALVFGVRDYVRKCGFKDVVLGLSGGIDSAVTCAVAVAALGKDRVTGVTMPSVFSSPGSIRDSESLAHNFGITLMEIPIKEIHDKYLSVLGPYFAKLKEDVTEENIQARIRGNLLMALANKYGSLVLATGNKSELAMGYCTLYGDMSGGLAVLSDVPKTLVYELAALINRESELIPAAIINKSPSAELRPDQKDEDSLPPYHVLDGILMLYLEQKKSARQIVAAGFEDDVVYNVIRAVDRNEFKRRQAAPGLKVTSKAFGSGRRMPVAADYGHDTQSQK